MKKLMVPVAAAALAVTLAACGGSNNNSTSKSTTSAASSTTSRVLKDTRGMALYTPVGESASNIRCTGSCTSIWVPLRPGAAKLSGSSTITRPDGTKQLVINGKPLYTFAQDSPGQMSGNGAKDAFGGKQFTWHAVQTGGTTAAASQSRPSSSGGGYGNGGY